MFLWITFILYYYTIKMPGKITDSHKIHWHELVKTDVSTRRFHIPSLISYLIDIIILIINICNHLANGSYFAFGLTLVIHFASTYLISYLYKCNEEIFDEDNTVFHNELQRRCIISRTISRWFGITPLFRILSNWNDQKEKHETIRTQRILRREINKDEVEAVVLNKRRKLVKTYFDCIHAYFKTFPQCILQIYLTVDTGSPLIFCTFTDVIRIFTMIWSIYFTSKVVADYTCISAEYLKAMQFQDYLIYGHGDGINPLRPKQLLASTVWNITVIGSRLYAIAFLLTLGGGWAPTQILFLFILNTIWIRSNSATRPKYENLPSGRTTFTSDFVDRFIGIFCFHEIRLHGINIMIHQLLFASVFFSITIVNVLINLTFFQENLNQVSYHIPSPCNFSIFSFSNGLTQYFNELLNSQWKQNVVILNISNTTSLKYVPTFGTYFKEIFSNEIVAFVLLSFAGLCSIIYTFYLKNEKPNSTTSSNFPLQISLKSWEFFLKHDWENIPNISKALQLVLLGVLDTNALELCNFHLPNNIDELKIFLKNYLIIKGNNFQNENPILLENNPCHDSLTKLIKFLEQNKFEEELDVCKYFQKYFYICMNEMTSHRIAQTENIISSNCDFHSWFSFEIRAWIPNGFKLYCCSKNKVQSEIENVFLNNIDT